MVIIILIILLLVLVFLIRFFIYKKQNSGLEVNIKQYFKINGIKHYVTIRGKKNNAPILITLHGGPNCSLIPYSFMWQNEIEKNYIVVNYDQRLCGRTVMKNFKIKTATQEELIEDLKYLIEYLKQIFKFDKVTLLGHSGGTILGIEFIEKYPELVEKYIGVSQIYNFKKGIKKELSKVLTNSKITDIDKYRVKLILEQDKNLDSVQEMMVAFKYIFKYLKQPEPIFKLILMQIFSPYMGIIDWWYFTHSNKGNEEYGFLKFDLEDKILNSEIKYNFILGNEDHTICPDIIKKFAENKENIKIYCIRNCGHVPMYAKTKEFNEIISKI